jgi:fibronectin type 3 domain-containing protein
MITVGNTTSTSFVDTSAGLAAGTTYYYAVAAYDEAMNYSAQTALATAATLPDTQPPTVPQKLVVTAKSGTQINLTWSASTDNVAVYDYRIYRGTTAQSLSLIGGSGTTSYSDSQSLKANQTYYYAVSALDASGNASAQSAVVSVINP